ncbi:MAG: hypothetical protein INQ03_02580 [Candidatus Heimdallarchaeota archaeon]|nr:hypothetical protein [Candidatus Heimdallarchaeota archaeon]
MNEDIIKSKAWQLLIRLFKQAKEDGQIDFDEGRILSSTDLNVNNLINNLREAWEDKILTSTERANLEFLVRKIEDDAISLAEYDNIITEQEQALLDIIREILDGFSEDPNFF